MCSGKGQIILEEDSKEWNNSAIKRPRAAAFTSVNILCLDVFSLNVLKFDLYLLKEHFQSFK